MSNIYRSNTKIRLTMLCLSCLELYSHWVPLGSLLCSERFFCGYSGFLSSPQKATFYLISGSSASKTFIYFFTNLFTKKLVYCIIFGYYPLSAFRNFPFHYWTLDHQLDSQKQSQSELGFVSWGYSGTRLWHQGDMNPGPAYYSGCPC